MIIIPVLISARKMEKQLLREHFNSLRRNKIIQKSLISKFDFGLNSYENLDTVYTIGLYNCPRSVKIYKQYPYHITYFTAE